MIRDEVGHIPTLKEFTIYVRGITYIHPYYTEIVTGLKIFYYYYFLSAEYSEDI